MRGLTIIECLCQSGNSRLGHRKHVYNSTALSPLVGAASARDTGRRGDLVSADSGRPAAPSRGVHPLLPRLFGDDCPLCSENGTRAVASPLFRGGQSERPFPVLFGQATPGNCGIIPVNFAKLGANIRIPQVCDASAGFSKKVGPERACE